MNRIASLAALAFAVAAGSAFADDITIDPVQHQSLKSRTEVQAELAQYQKARVNPWSTSYNQFSQSKSLRDRADVRAEAVASVQSGETAALTGEDSGSAYLAKRPAVTTTLVIAQSQR
jgi:polyisoprenoid-binding protein YceI